jgi:hypothetical protein
VDLRFLILSGFCVNIPDLDCEIGTEYFTKAAAGARIQVGYDGKGAVHLEDPRFADFDAEFTPLAPLALYFDFVFYSLRGLRLRHLPTP